MSCSGLELIYTQTVRGLTLGIGIYHIGNQPLFYTHFLFFFGGGGGGGGGHNWLWLYCDKCV